jgi:menaquinone-dependent protoporphyrinogen oxidase
MRVLVAVGSRHGSTIDIANQLAAELRIFGLIADVQNVENVRDLDACEAVVVGSAVYMGRWVPSARSFVERFRTQLTDLPVWIFSSGPLGDPPVPDEVLKVMRRSSKRLRRVASASSPGVSIPRSWVLASD